MSVLLNSTFIKKYAENFVVSGIFQFATDVAGAARKTWNGEKAKKELVKELENYTKEQKQKLDGEWDAVEACILKNGIISIEKDRLKNDLQQAGGSRDILLEQWMKRCQECPDVTTQFNVRSFCGGWIDTLFKTILKDPDVQNKMQEWRGEAAVSGIHKLQKTAGDTLAQINQNELNRQADQVELMNRLVQNKDRKSDDTLSEVITVKDSTQKYLDRWTELLFLNKPGDIDDDIPPVCLGQVHTPYRYEALNPRTREKKESTDEAALMKRLAFSGGHLVLGDPGIGKSTLISWYLNKSGCDPKKTPVYVLSHFRLTGKEQRPGDTLLEQMGKKRDDLKGCTLFLDGLDECGLTPGQRADFINRLNENWGNRFSWVITCRLNYIGQHDLDELDIPRLTLLPLNPSQRGEFLTKYEAAAHEGIPADKLEALVSDKLEGEFGSPFGIPLILYMAAAMESITVTENSTLVTVYDQLFDQLFQRKYDHSRRHGLMKEEELRENVRKMSRQTALWMLHHQPEKAFIPKADYEKIEEGIGGSIQTNWLHRFFSFLHITEGEKEVCFVHRTMYEYFVAEGFVSLAVAAETPEELSGVIGWYWYREQMSITIEQYAEEKLKQERDALDFSRWEDAGLLLMEKGARRCCEGMKTAFFQCLKYERSDSLVEDRRRENTAFWHLCFLLSKVREITETSSLVFQRFEEAPEVLTSAMRHYGADCDHIFFPDYFLCGAYLSGTYLGGAYLPGANLAGAILTGADLTGAISYNADLTDSDLCRANLTGAHLSDANLCNADLTRADLCRANLTGAHLCDADLCNADLTDVDLCRANLTGAHLRHANMCRANMSFADLRRADMTCANLRGADMTAVFLSDANMTGADMTAAFLSAANMTGAELCGVNLTDAYLYDAKLTEKQVKSLGFQMLSSCIFIRIHVFNDAEGFAIYTRSDFFAHFFPDK